MPQGVVVSICRDYPTARALPVNTKVSIIAASVAACFAAAPVRAQDLEQTFAFYLLAAGMDGKVGLGPFDADLDVSFDDILHNLEFGTMMAYNADAGTWAFGVDAIFMEVKADKPVRQTGVFSAKAEQTMISLETAYELGDQLEVLGGLRYSEIELDAAVARNGVTTRASGRKESWTDPFVGVRYGVPFGDAWSLTLRADIGGFGVGSDFAWQLVTRFNWRPADAVDLFFGYRILDADFEDGDGANRFLFDVTTSGPLVGFAWHF